MVDDPAPVAPQFTDADLDGYAIRKMLAIELRKLKCNGLAKKVESGFDCNPRTLAAIAIIKRLSGL